MKFNPLNALFGSVVAALFCGISLFAAESALDLDPNMKLKPENTDGLKYLIPAEKPLRLSGFCWYDTDHVYRRLPLRPDGKLSRGVELLAWNTAGGQVAFRSDTGRIVLKVKMRSNSVMYHMAQTGTAGFDLYAGPPRQTALFRGHPLPGRRERVYGPALSGGTPHARLHDQLPLVCRS